MNEALKWMKKLRISISINSNGSQGNKRKEEGVLIMDKVRLLLVVVLWVRPSSYLLAIHAGYNEKDSSQQYTGCLSGWMLLCSFAFFFHTTSSHSPLYLDVAFFLSSWFSFLSVLLPWWLDVVGGGGEVQDDDDVGDDDVGGGGTIIFSLCSSCWL